MSARYVPCASGVVIRGQDSPQDTRTREIVREELVLAMAGLRRDIARDLARLVRQDRRVDPDSVALAARRKRGGGR